MRTAIVGKEGAVAQANLSRPTKGNTGHSGNIPGTEADSDQISHVQKGENRVEGIATGQGLTLPAMSRSSRVIGVQGVMGFDACSNQLQHAKKTGVSIASMVP